MIESYTLTQEELEAAVSNWLHQSGGHVLDKFNSSFEPITIECMGGEVWIDFEMEE